MNKILYKMNNILHRISQISDFEKITISKIEQKIGASKGVLYKAIQNNTDIQSKWVVSIVENFPQYSPEWLLTGKGEILKENFNLKNANYLHDNVEEKKDDKDYIIEVQKKLIEKLEQEVKELKEQDNKTKV